MKHLPSSSLRRAGFTLVELLVVIAIIGTLLGILVPAIMKIRGAALRTGTATEIAELDAAIKQKFFTKYNIYPPSHITLPPTSSQDQAIIKQMFPGINLGAVSWGGTAGTTLTGDQCLVFFLGGINGKGFAKDPANPSNTAVAWDPPMFVFIPARLKPGAGGFNSYIDYFGKGQPYAYFSSKSGYASDCSALGVAPYQSAAGVFLNPDSFQIISAGSDGQFGPGNPANAGPFLSANGSGGVLTLKAQDDLANFGRGGVLGGY